MNIFVAGIHGVGKTYLASQVAIAIDMTHTSASKLIKEERSLSTWANDKRVSDVAENQRALADAVRRHNELGARLLLDGHFVLVGQSGELIRLEVDVFLNLNLTGVILIEASTQVVSQRIADRDQRQVSLDHLETFMNAEREQAEKVCAELYLPLAILDSPTPEEFVRAVNHLSGQSLANKA